MALFRFPVTEIEVSDPTMVVAIKTADGKNYRMTLATFLGMIGDTTFTGTIKATGLPTEDPEDGESVWLNSGVLTIASAP